MDFIAQAPAWAETIGTVVLSSAGASILYWVSKRRGADNPEAFKVEKAAITLGVAFVLSFALAATGRATGIEQLLPHLSVAVGPTALYVQKVVNEYQRTGRIHLRNASVDEAAQAVADGLGVSIDDVLAVGSSTHAFDFDSEGENKSKPKSQSGTPASHPAAEPATPDAAESESVTAIAGIGSGRSSDLSGAGVETVEDLAAADIQRLAAESGLSATRLKKWQAQARER